MPMRDKRELQANPGLSVIHDDMAEIVGGLGDDVHTFSGKTVLITGASGMLPAYLADAVAYCNHHVLREPARVVLLVRSAPYDGSRLAHLACRSDVEFLVQDVCEPISVAGPLHFIVHAASPATPANFKRDPVGTVEANSIGLRQLLNLAKERDTESFLFFSSSEVYGTPEPENIPTPETYFGRVNFATSRSYYAEAKRFGEAMCCAYYEQYGVPAKSVRPFHVHGPGMRSDDGRIVAAMIGLGLNRKRFELQSDGTATRTYGYISDATIAFFKVLLSQHNGHTFNVGADAPETSMLELATIISRVFGNTEPVQVGAHPAGADSPARACPDLTKIRSLLGYRPRVPLETGLERTIAWLRAQPDVRQQVAR